MNRELQTQEGKFNRENARQLELFRAQLQIFLQEKQKDLQLQLKEIDTTLARELKAIDLQNNLTVIHQQRRLNNWPLTLDDEQIKEIVKSDNLLIYLFHLFLNMTVLVLVQIANLILFLILNKD